MVSPAFVVFAPFFVREAIYFLTGKLTVFPGVRLHIHFDLVLGYAVHFSLLFMGVLL